MDEIKIDTIEWSAPEYTHKERTNDWFWALGLITIVGSIVAFWFKNNIFGIFILLSGGCFAMFTIRQPHDANYKIETKGLTMGRDFYTWKSIKSFNIKKNDHEDFPKLLIETSKYFLPIYTIPLSTELENQIKESLLKILPRSEIDESRAMIFVEKLGL